MATSQPTHTPAGSIAPNCQFRWQTHELLVARRRVESDPPPGSMDKIRAGANTGNTAAGERDSH